MKRWMEHGTGSRNLREKRLSGQPAFDVYSVGEPPLRRGTMDACRLRTAAAENQPGLAVAKATAFQARKEGLTASGLLRARETDAVETPARAATARMPCFTDLALVSLMNVTLHRA